MITRKLLLPKTLEWIRESQGYTKLFKDELDRLDALGRPPTLDDLRDETVISWTAPLCDICLRNVDAVVDLGMVDDARVFICADCLKIAGELVAITP